MALPGRTVRISFTNNVPLIPAASISGVLGLPGTPAHRRS